MDEKTDIWIINIPILSTSCPYNGRMLSGAFPLVSEFIKDKCHNPSNPEWLLWTYPECNQKNCPIKAKGG